MTIWIAALPKLKDPFEKQTEFVPPFGWTMFKRTRPVRVKLLEDVVETFNVFKFEPDDPTWNGFWLPKDPKGAMTDEAQTAINRALCEIFVQTEDHNCNVALLWYLPPGVSPDQHCPDQISDNIRPPITSLRQINLIRAAWLTRMFA